MGSGGLCLSRLTGLSSGPIMVSMTQPMLSDRAYAKLHWLGILLVLAIAFAVGLFVPPPPPADAATRGNSSQAFTQDRVYVVNTADRRWPVAAAAEKLDNRSKLDLVVVTRCPKTNQCIYIRSGAIPQAGLIATTETWRAGGHLAGATITMDDAWLTGRGSGDPDVDGESGYNLSPAEEYYSTIHELGHAIGLKHSESVGSVMMPIVQMDRTPSSRDYRKMRGLYR